MDSFPIQEIPANLFPTFLREINDPPEKLYIRGSLPAEDKYKFLCVVGSRKYSSYGKEVCEQLISGLSGYPIVIVSGLALGMDAIAHKAALENNLLTIAFPGSGLDKDKIYPRTNLRLASHILHEDGALVSEFEPEFKATSWAFPKRNRLMAGISSATLVVEATKKSGTLITARLAMEYNRDVLTVPGSIFSRNTAGPHSLIRDGATPICNSSNLLLALGFDITEENTSKSHKNLSPTERQVLEILGEPLAKHELTDQLDMSITQAQILLSEMELKGLIKEVGGKIRQAS